MKNKILAILAITLLSVFAAKAQIAQGGNYSLDQSVIAGGGGTSADSTGNLYSLTGAIGQAVADTTGASNSPYKIQSGFFTPATLSPTAATVNIGGRVTTTGGRGIRNIQITLTDASGSVRTAMTTAFGYYRFTDVAAGGVYIITAQGKRFTFTQPTQVLNVSDDTNDINFIGDAASSFKDLQ